MRQRLFRQVDGNRSLGARLTFGRSTANDRALTASSFYSEKRKSGLTASAMAHSDLMRMVANAQTKKNEIATSPKWPVLGSIPSESPHTRPPRHLLDLAQRHALRVIGGLSAEQHVGYGAAASGPICAWASATGIMFSDATTPSLRSCQ